MRLREYLELQGKDNRSLQEGTRVPKAATGHEYRFSNSSEFREFYFRSTTFDPIKGFVIEAEAGDILFRYCSTLEDGRHLYIADEFGEPQYLVVDAHNTGIKCRGLDSCKELKSYLGK